VVFRFRSGAGSIPRRLGLSDEFARNGRPVAMHYSTRDILKAFHHIYLL
jgi:hypothetical protein